MWEKEECIAEKNIGWDVSSYKNKNGAIQLFAAKLEVKKSVLSKIFTVLETDDNSMLMESLLQCKLWMDEDPLDDIKIVDAECCSKACLKEYFEQNTKLKTTPLDMLSEKVVANKPISIEGMFLNGNSDQSIIYCEKNGLGIFHLINPVGELQEELRISLKILQNSFWIKHYIKDGIVGFLTKDNKFVLYKHNYLLSEFPDIGMDIVSPWNAYMPDRNTIFMEWACYDVRSGNKKWDFPHPIDKKAYKKFILFEMWSELPNGFFVTQINVDQEIMYISVINQKGVILNSISLKISYAYHYVKVSKKYIYVFQEPENTRNLAEITLFDFELKKIGIYQIELDSSDKKICFDSNNSNIYVINNETILQINIANGEKQAYKIPLTLNFISSWGILQNDICYIIKNERVLFLLNLHNNMACILNLKIKGYFLKLRLLNTGNLLLVSQDNRKKGQVVFQEICFNESKL